MIPSVYLDKRFAGDKNYVISLNNAQVNECLDCVDSKPYGSVIYVSFGRLEVLKEDQIIFNDVNVADSSHSSLGVAITMKYTCLLD